MSDPLGTAVHYCCPSGEGFPKDWAVSVEL